MLNKNMQTADHSRRGEPLSEAGYRALGRFRQPSPRTTTSMIGFAEIPAGMQVYDGTYGKIQWQKDYDALMALKLFAKPTLDGNFLKWQSGPIDTLNASTQIQDGADLWKGSEQFSSRVAIRWDDDNLYIGVDVTDPQLYQPFFGRGVQDGDVVRLILDTALPRAVRKGRPNE